MELEFVKQPLNCLRENVREVQEYEQTQEIRLPDGMPDIGRILGAWGQCVMRGKQWESTGMGCNGGVMAWVLYAPEDGSDPRSVEAWLPMQFKWSFREDSRREGAIRTSWKLRSVDARTLSARKMMVRACAEVLGQALEPETVDVSVPDAMPEDVQLLRRTYPLTMAREAGEKAFPLEETLSLAEGSARPDILLNCRVQPRMTEASVVGGKAVFRGELGIRALCRYDDGKLRCVDRALGFSQFSDLDRDYEGEPELDVMMAVSGLEPELTDGSLHLKSGLVVQYLVRETKPVELVEDAYSNSRDIRMQMGQLSMPLVLDARTQEQHPSVTWDGGAVVDLSFCPGQPRVRRAGGLAEVEQPGVFQVLYYDDRGGLQGETLTAETLWELPVGGNASVMARMQETGWPHVSGGELHGDLQMEAVTEADSGLAMVTGLELGELTQPDPGRPSVILRRAETGSLWELAKASGSTVSAILAANGLQSEPEPGRMLLIPVP